MFTVWSAASNLEVANNLLRGQANSASYPRRDGETSSSVGYEVMILIEAMICLQIAPRLQLSVSMSNVRRHNAPLYNTVHAD